MIDEMNALVSIDEIYHSTKDLIRYIEKIRRIQPDFVKQHERLVIKLRKIITDVERDRNGAA